MTEQQTVICVGCPLGCSITLILNEQGDINEIRGNCCREGKAYARKEYLNPVRVLTAAVRTAAGYRPLLPVKTDKPIAKAYLLPGMSALAPVRVRPPVKMGEIIIANFMGTGANLVSTVELP